MNKVEIKIMTNIQLKGIAWSHSRGIDPLRACIPLLAERGIDIQWDTRPLQGFEEASIEMLAASYDLMSIDHPFMGDAFAQKALQPICEIIGKGTYQDYRDNAVGPSTSSYEWMGKLWAAPVDAASQVAAYRPDFLAEIDVPKTWDDVLKLSNTGKVGMAANPTHMLLAYATICHAFADTDAVLPDLRPVWWSDEGIERETALKALACLKRLMSKAVELSWNADPIDIFNHMTTHDDIFYTPVAFGYSNYARPGEYAKPLNFTAVPSCTGTVGAGMLGGVGLAVSRRSTEIDAIRAVLEVLSSQQIQSGIYAESGGQPAHRHAWTDKKVNEICPNFFEPTLESLDKSFVRPRVPGYPAFQRKGGELLHQLVREDAPDRVIVDKFNDLWRHFCRPEARVK
ncbi:extracellular solute-binding protein [Phyllobacterium sp. 21LDTY02-6]|uniref:ABC transporter substrate-binding protein n=1 Tax=Phyllobacterium sp. 21LDTY02-6 TaxID=2944903 RepID=UPI0020226A5D|nr:extracellular solute-binding protein [Phyllobacterium sp. 21LDTY02-6]MCO4319162.1 extracellular solute-binding protein [Phyllobacterium sp. 21LDTY02-6]